MPFPIAARLAPIRHYARVDELAVVVSAAVREHDPLDPWLTESGRDEHYWDREAELIARRLTPSMDSVAVRAVVSDVLGGLLGTSADGDAGVQEQSKADRPHRRRDLEGRSLEPAAHECAEGAGTARAGPAFPCVPSCRETA
ncbi:MAG: hypothetical protein QOI95_3175 [Acidimicrobiaceae bacterium]